MSRDDGRGGSPVCRGARHRSLLALTQLGSQVYTALSLVYRMEVHTCPDDLAMPEAWRAAEAAIKDALNSTGREWELRRGHQCADGPVIKTIVPRFHVGVASSVHVSFRRPVQWRSEYRTQTGEIAAPVLIHRCVTGPTGRKHAVSYRRV